MVATQLPDKDIFAAAMWETQCNDGIFCGNAVSHHIDHHITTVKPGNFCCQRYPKFHTKMFAISSRRAVRSIINPRVRLETSWSINQGSLKNISFLHGLNIGGKLMSVFLVLLFNSFATSIIHCSGVERSPRMQWKQLPKRRVNLQDESQDFFLGSQVFWWVLD